jgi:uncharacterized protein YecE (DUF72 family)
VGTSGWTYGSWSGPFYPPAVKGSDRLRFYAERFATVEVNATFYRLPTITMAEAWNRRLPTGFRLVLKGSRVVTHMKKLVAPGRALEVFLERALTMRHLAVLLWQLPPVLARGQETLDRLDRFLAGLPATVRHAVEFRHPSWWDGSTAKLLARHRAAFVAVSHPCLPREIVPTTDLVYLRFHGEGPRLYHYDYSRDQLVDWARRARAAAGAGTVYAFFNNDVDAHAPANARVLADELDRVSP